MALTPDVRDRDMGPRRPTWRSNLPLGASFACMSWCLPTPLVRFPVRVPTPVKVVLKGFEILALWTGGTQ